MTIPTSSGDDMLREVKAKFIHGKIEPLEDLQLSEGEEVTILVKDTASSPPKLLFGLLKGSVKIKGDIISPIDDAGWNALQ